MSIAKHHVEQPLTAWPGDLASLIGEMKRRAGVATDQELAGFMGVAQSTVANWRKRGAVPEAALLRFERALSEGPDDGTIRAVYASCITLRLPELWAESIAKKRGEVDRTIPYLTVAMTFKAITAEVARQMAKLEREHSLSSRELFSQLLQDETFLGGLLDWVQTASASDMLAAELVQTDRSAP